MRQDVAAWQALVWRVIAVAIAACVLALGGSPALAQQTYTFTAPTNGTLNDTATSCGNPLVRNFSVSNNFVLGDVDIGIRGAHTYRGDIRITLQHPDGTRVRVVDGSGSIWGDNFNYRLDDAAGQTVNTDGNGTNHSTGAVNGGFQNNFKPNAALSAFNGKSSSGTWRLEVCDQFPADSGTFYHAELYLTSLVTSGADLSLSKAVSNSAPTAGIPFIYTLTVQNASYSTQTATATVIDQLPVGVAYISHNGDGTYVPSTGLWSFPSIAPNQTRTLNIVVTTSATAGATITNIAEIASSNRADIDSTPGNGVTSEDDYAASSFTVAGTRVAGTAPSLVCPDGVLTFNWAGRSWPTNSTANNYTLTGFGAFNWSISNPGTWMNIGDLGGQQPTLTNGAQGITALSEGIDFGNRDQIAITTVTLGAIVDGAQFTIFDIDYGANDFADFVRVTGLRGATQVIPVLTNGVTNYVIGNAAYGDAGASSSTDNGDVIVTFSQPIDQIVIEYGNHSLAPNNPDGQAIQMSGGIKICTPVADLSVEKSSKMLSDPVLGVSEDAFTIPGARIEYCIAITNDGSATAVNVTAVDDLPDSLIYQTGTLRSGTTCENANTVEDEDATGTDDTVSIGASFDSGTVGMAVDSLASGANAAITFEAVVE